MLDLKLDADLVVLSACETGRGRIAPGEGIVGTMWAFFVAGSRALLVSQWKVESASTTELMTDFHRGLAGGSGTKAEHLRLASLARLRHPAPRPSVLLGRLRPGRESRIERGLTDTPRPSSRGRPRCRS